MFGTKCIENHNVVGIMVGYVLTVWVITFNCLFIKLYIPSLILAAGYILTHICTSPKNRLFILPWLNH